LLILVTRRGKEVSESGREVERLEEVLREVEIYVEVEKRKAEEQVKIVGELREN
jgi:hypothetical protein